MHNERLLFLQDFEFIDKILVARRIMDRSSGFQLYLENSVVCQDEFVFLWIFFDQEENFLIIIAVEGVNNQGQRKGFGKSIPSCF